MTRRILALASLAVVGTIIVACAASDNDPGPPQPPSDGDDGADAGYTWERPTGDVGTRQRKARGQKCCYKDKFYTCKKEADCYGGFDFTACIEGCGEDEDCAYGKCREQLYHAPPPTADCVEGEMPKAEEVVEGDDAAEGDEEPAAPVDGEEVGDDDVPFTCDYSL